MTMDMNKARASIKSLEVSIYLYNLLGNPIKKYILMGFLFTTNIFSCESISMKLRPWVSRLTTHWPPGTGLQIGHLIQFLSSITVFLKLSYNEQFSTDSSD